VAQKPVSKLDDVAISNTYKVALESQARKNANLNKSFDIAAGDQYFDKLSKTPDNKGKRMSSKVIEFK
jgi:hypothetical protein